MTTQLDTDTARLVAALADLQGRISELTEQAEAIKAELRTLPPADYDIGGRPALRIIPTRRFDAVSALAALPDSLRPTCLKVEPDPAAIKRHLTPEQADTFMVDAGKPKCVLL